MTRKKKTDGTYNEAYTEVYEAIEYLRAVIKSKRANQDRRRTDSKTILAQLAAADLSLVVTRNHIRVVERLENDR